MDIDPSKDAAAKIALTLGGVGAKETERIVLGFVRDDVNSFPPSSPRNVAIKFHDEDEERGVGDSVGFGCFHRRMQGSGLPWQVAKMVPSLDQAQCHTGDSAA
jgi:hypothetical protein